MLVCAYNCAFWHTRPRVQSAPGFPCALWFGEGQRICKTSGETRRENNFRRPGQASNASADPGPIRRGGCCLKKWSTALLQQLKPVVMGPCSRAQLRTRQGRRRSFCLGATSSSSTPKQKIHPCPCAAASSASLRRTAARPARNLPLCPTAHAPSLLAVRPQIPDDAS